MDCRSFEDNALDYALGEVSLNGAAAVHVDSCLSCTATLAQLRGGIRIAESIEQAPVPEGFEDRVMAMAESAVAVGPVSQSASSTVLQIDGRVSSRRVVQFAMRPQVAAAAVLLLMVGSTALLLRGRSSDEVSRSKPTAVRAESAGEAKKDESERGTAAKDEREGKAAESPSDKGMADDESSVVTKKPASALAEIGKAKVADPFVEAMAAYTAGRWADAAARFDRLEVTGTKSAVSLLYAGRSFRALESCVQALDRFEKVLAKYTAEAEAGLAALEGGQCAQTLGDRARARGLFDQAKKYPATKARAEKALADLSKPDSPVRTLPAPMAPKPHPMSDTDLK